MARDDNVLKVLLVGLIRYFMFLNEYYLQYKCLRRIKYDEL